MAKEFIVTFDSPLDSFTPNFNLHNGSDVYISTVAFSGKTAQFPITWDKIGEMEGNVTLAGKQGEDTEVVYLYFYDFKPGETVYFRNGDLDFTGDPRSAVPIAAIEGTRVLIQLDNRLPATGEFKAVEGRMQAVISLEGIY